MCLIKVKRYKITYISISTTAFFVIFFYNKAKSSFINYFKSLIVLGLIFLINSSKKSQTNKAFLRDLFYESVAILDEVTRDSIVICHK